MPDLSALKEQVCKANLELVAHRLVVFTWGNVSQIDRTRGLVAIKPSGVSYDALKPDDIVVLDLDGEVVEGRLRPSSDTPTHLELYRQFKEIGGVTHTHSRYATMWAQSYRDLPCLGTTHADYFYGSVPVTAQMTDAQVRSDYELNTGKVIVKRFRNIDPMQMPAVLVASHGPFTWGKDAMDSVHSAVVLEECARIAAGTLMLSPDQPSIRQTLLDKHYLRKHGHGAYYGQK